MRAVVYTRHGGPEVLSVHEMPRPAPGPNDVLVRVKAVALNHLDVWIRAGLPRLKVTFPHIPGADVAGVVEQTGSAVHTARPGDEVIVAPGISCGVCEYCVAGEDNLCREYSILGEHRHGGYADYVAIPQ